ncbi:hypothetical protein GCM10011506_36870 [Marivirga lumbricoides]|uniref:Tyrosine kinase G-rich domain-containing protein n=1 Tax=Marivirga lumbricoides TaxID=1046115 RepID=A0ABQ1N2V0_9BACT|nr:hypothetical protein GCM10011506_36870 [Marivirga lumbricoides]
MQEHLGILRPYFRGLPLIILATMIGFVVASKYLNYVTPMYESTTTLKLADISEGVNNSNLFKDFDVFATSNKIAGEIEVLKSQVLLNKVLDELNFDVEIYRVGKIRSVELYDQSPFLVEKFNVGEQYFDKKFDVKVAQDGSYAVNVPHEGLRKGKIGDTLQLEKGQILIRRNEVLLAGNPYLQVADHYEFELISRNKLMGMIKKDLDIMAVDKDVAVIKITTKSAVPQKASLLVNKIAEIYIHDYIDSKYKVANVTVNFLENQIGAVNERLTDAEDKIQDFRNQKGITNIFQENETNLRKISQLKIQQTNLKMGLDAIQELEKYVKEGADRFLELAPNFEAFTDLLSTEIVKNIKKLQAEKMDLLLVYTTEDERVKIIDDKIEDLKNYLIESISNTRNNLQIKYDNLTADIEEAELVFKVVPENEKMLTILNREFQIYQQSYNYLNEKKIEAEIAQAAKIAFHRVITPGNVPKVPVSPNKPIIKIVSAMLGMFGALALIFVVHALKAKVNDKRTIESRSMIPLSALSPKLKTSDSIFEHFQKLTAQLEIKGLMGDKYFMTLSSFKAQDGAPFNTLQLTKALARQGRKVLLIDVDNTLGIAECTPGEVHEFGDLISYLSLNDNRYKCYSKERLSDMLRRVSSDFQVTLALNGNIGSQMSLLMMSLADVNMVVLDARLTPAKKVLEVDLLKEEYKLPNMHFLLNRYAYTPSIFREIKLIFMRLFKRTKATKELSWQL